MEEQFPIVQEDGTRIGQASRQECHSGSMLLHPVIHLHVFNSKGELFLQKRSPNKDILPNKWDSSVGGHLNLDETPLEAAIREAWEEIGIIIESANYIGKHVFESQQERELTYCFYLRYDGPIRIDQEEVTDGRFWSMDDIANSLHQGLFTPNFEYDFKHFLKNIKLKLLK